MKSGFKFRIASAILLSASLFASCSEWSEDNDPTNSKMAMGAAAGGVIGAGLGAIVGSQTGSAGAGMLIGGAAGAGAGAGIGNYLDEEDESLERNDKRLAKNQQAINTNKREIETLKSASDPSRIPSEWRDTRKAPMIPGSRMSQNGTGSSKSLAAAMAKVDGGDENPSAGYANYSNSNNRANQAYARPDNGYQPSRNSATITNPNALRNTARVEEKDLDANTYADSGKTKNYTVRKVGDASIHSVEEKTIEDSDSKARLTNKPSNIFAPINSKPLENKPINEKAAEVAEVETVKGFNDSAAETSGLNVVKEREVAVKPLENNITQPAALGKQSAKSDVVIEKNIKGGDSAREEIDPEVARIMNGEDIVTDSVSAGTQEKELQIEEPAKQKLQTAKLNPAVESNTITKGECAQAEEEMNKATVASDNADKLFHYRRALRLCPNEPAYHNALGELYLGLKRRSDAEYEFNEALNVDKTYKPAKENLEKVKRY